MQEVKSKGVMGWYLISLHRICMAALRLRSSSSLARRSIIDLLQTATLSVSVSPTKYATLGETKNEDAVTYRNLVVWPRLRHPTSAWSYFRRLEANYGCHIVPFKS